MWEKLSHTDVKKNGKVTIHSWGAGRGGKRGSQQKMEVELELNWGETTEDCKESTKLLGRVVKGVVDVKQHKTKPDKTSTPKHKKKKQTTPVDLGKERRWRVARGSS